MSLFACNQAKASQIKGIVNRKGGTQVIPLSSIQLLIRIKCLDF